jgi:hypothetical protein
MPEIENLEHSAAARVESDKSNARRRLGHQGVHFDLGIGIKTGYAQCGTAARRPRPAIILSAYSLCIGVSGHSGRDRSTIVWRTDAAVDVFRSSPTP